MRWPPGFTGFPAPPPSPWLNGKNSVVGPTRRVVICTSRLLTAKCTSAPRGNVNSGSGAWPLGFGDRSRRYCSIASPILWVKSVFSSTVATGRPFKNSTRSIAFSLCSE